MSNLNVHTSLKINTREQENIVLIRRG